MKTLFKYIFALLMLVNFNIHAQVNVVNIITTTGSNTIYDLANPSNINVSFTKIVNSPTYERGYPQVVITGNNGITVRSINNAALYDNTNLIWNVPVLLTTTQLNQLFDIANLNISGMSALQEQEYREYGTLPNGVYSVCVELWSYGAIPIKISNPGVGCASWIIGTGGFSNSLREPPKTLMPACQTHINAFDPQQIIFTWLDPSSFSDLRKGAQEYIIKMVEVVGNQSPYDAIVTSSVPPFFQKTVFGTSYVYGLSDPPLKKGAKYAYVVAVKNDVKKYQNNGVSETCWFVYGENEKSKTPDAQSNVNNKPAPGSKGITFTPSSIFEPIPSTVIKGKLVYAFRKSELNTPTSLSINSNDYQSNITLGKVTESLFDDPNFFNKNSSSEQTNSNIWNDIKTGTNNNTQNYSGLNAQNGFNANILEAIPKSVDEEIWEKSLASVANEAGKDRFPLANSLVEVRLFLKYEIAKKISENKNANPFFKAPKNGILLGTALTDNEGNFSVSYNKGDINIADYYVELFVVNNTQFDFPVLPIPIDLSLFGVFDLGEIIGLANTYRLNIKLISNSGKKIENAKVQILRTKGIYMDKPYLNPEGNRFYEKDKFTINSSSKNKQDEKDISNSSTIFYGLEKNRTSVDRELVAERNNSLSFLRLFTANDQSEVYILKISAENFLDTEVPLYFLPNGSYNTSNASTKSSTSNGVLTVNATYYMTAEKSKVIGRVIDKTNETPLANLDVKLYNEDKSIIYSTKTLENGTFVIKNINAVDDNFTLTVSGANIKEWSDKTKLRFDEDGIVKNYDPLYVSAQLIPITGIVSNLSSQPLNNVELKWKEGGKSFYTASNGHYVGYNVAGKHTLLITKPGYKSKEIQVDLAAPSISSNNLSEIKPKYGLDKNNNTPNAQNISAQFGNVIISSENGFDFSKLTTNSNNKKSKKNFTSIENSINTIIAENKIDNFFLDMQEESNSNFGPGVVIDTIKLSQFFVNVQVKDKSTNSPIENAIVSLSDNENEKLTDKKGNAVLENVHEGTSNIYVAAPSGTNYIGASASIAVQPSKDTTTVEIFLSVGATLKGKVFALGKSVSAAEIYIEGKPYIKTKTDNNGNYSIGVPTGEYTLIASKTGYIADKKSMTFENKIYTQDFELKDPGFNASTILGFDLILLASTSMPTPNEFKISGQITNIPSNTLFSISKAKKIDFIDQIVIKQGDNIVPKSGTLVLVDQQLDFKLFDYLNVNLKKAGGLKVVSNNGDNTKGIISGELLLDVKKTFQSKYGLTWPEGIYKLQSSNTGDFNAFYSNASAPDIATLKLEAPTSGWEVFGIKLKPDFNNTSINKNGLNIAGSIELTDVPGLGNASLNINTFQIGTNGDIIKLELDVDPNPELNFMSWKMILNKASINQYGLRFGGKLSVPIPSSNAANFIFSDVNVTKSGLNGGSYKLLGNINIFDVASFSGITTSPFSIGKVVGTNYYKINGGGSLSFNSSLLDKDISIQDFSISSDANLKFSASPNLNFDFANGMASFKLNGLNLSTSNKEISLNGGFGLNIPGFGGAINSNIHYSKSNIRIDKLGLSASLGSIGSYSANVEFDTNKFLGDGKISISGITDLSMAFEYSKLNNNKKIKADIKTNLAISIGVLTFEKIGGGFIYHSSANKYGVNLTGRMTLAPGTSAAVALENIIVGVEASPAGPVLYGSAVPSILSMNVGYSEFKFDIPQKSFFINTNLSKSLNIIPNVGMSASGSFMLAASAKSADTYWLIALYTKMKMLGLFDENLNITAAYNLQRASHPEFIAYTSFIPEAYLNAGKINGIHTSFKSLKGRTKDNAVCNGVSGLATLCAYAYADMNLNIHSNLSSGTFGFDVSQNWGAGGSADFVGYPVAGASVSVGFGLNGAYNGNAWTINGSGSANANAHVGCAGSGCGNGVSWGCCVDPCVWSSCEVCPCPCGARICIHPSVSASYSSANGDFNVDLDW